MPNSFSILRDFCFVLLKTPNPNIIDRECRHYDRIHPKENFAQTQTLAFSTSQ